MTGPFGDDGREYLVIANDEDQLSLWPASMELPAGWAVTGGPADRRTCIELVEATWTDMRPRSLRGPDAGRGRPAGPHRSTAEELDARTSPA